MRGLLKRKLKYSAIKSDQGGIMKTILVVDDDTAFLSSLAEMVSMIEPEYDVMTAENGDQAIAVLRTIPVDLLITDIRMPVVSGSELVLWMRENMPQTPVIAMSAGNDVALAVPVEGEGYSFFDKPLDVPGLIESIRTLLHKEEKA
jgi:two-component system, NtrC family, response regulator HydG